MNLYYLARINNNRYKKQTRIFFISVILSSFLFLFFITISGSIKYMIHTINEENYEFKKIEVFVSQSFAEETRDSFLENPPSIIEDNFIKSLFIRPEVDSINVKYQLNKKTFDPFNQSFKLCIEDCEIIVASIDGVDPQYNTFSNFEINKAVEIYDDFDNHIISGNDFENTSFKAALIDEYVVLKMGYFNLEEIIGKMITIQIEEIAVENVQIIGVFSYRLGASKNLPLTENPADISESTFEYFAPEKFNAISPIIVTKDIIENLSEEEIINSNYNVGQSKVVVETKSIYDIEPIVNFIEQKYSNNYIFSNLLKIKKTIEIYKNISIFFFILSSVILLVAIFSIFNSLISKIFVQRKFLKMLLIMGYTIKDIIKVYLMDNLIVLIKSIIIYISLTYFSTLLIEKELKNSYKTLYLKANNIFIAKAETIVLYTFILVLITTVIVLIVAKKEIVKYVKNKR